MDNLKNIKIYFQIALWCYVLFYHSYFLFPMPSSSLFWQKDVENLQEAMNFLCLLCIASEN